MPGPSGAAAAAKTKERKLETYAVTKFQNPALCFPLDVWIPSRNERVVVLPATNLAGSDVYAVSVPCSLMVDGAKSFHRESFIDTKAGHAMRDLVDYFMYIVHVCNVEHGSKMIPDIVIKKNRDGVGLPVTTAAMSYVHTVIEKINGDDGYHLLQLFVHRSAQFDAHHAVMKRIAENKRLYQLTDKSLVRAQPVSFGNARGGPAPSFSHWGASANGDAGDDGDQGHPQQQQQGKQNQNNRFGRGPPIPVKETYTPFHMRVRDMFEIAQIGLIRTLLPYTNHFAVGNWTSPNPSINQLHPLTMFSLHHALSSMTGVAKKYRDLTEYIRPVTVDATTEIMTFIHPCPERAYWINNSQIDIRTYFKYRIPNPKRDNIIHLSTDLARLSQPTFVAQTDDEKAELNTDLQNRLNLQESYLDKTQIQVVPLGVDAYLDYINADANSGKYAFSCTGKPEPNSHEYCFKYTPFNQQNPYQQQHQEQQHEQQQRHGDYGGGDGYEDEHEQKQQQQHPYPSEQKTDAPEYDDDAWMAANDPTHVSTTTTTMTTIEPAPFSHQDGGGTAPYGTENLSLDADIGMDNPQKHPLRGGMDGGDDLPQKGGLSGSATHGLVFDEETNPDGLMHSCTTRGLPETHFNYSLCIRRSIEDCTQDLDFMKIVFPWVYNVPMSDKERELYFLLRGSVGLESDDAAGKTEDDVDHAKRLNKYHRAQNQKELDEMKKNNASEDAIRAKAFELREQFEKNAIDRMKHTLWSTNCDASPYWRSCVQWIKEQEAETKGYLFDNYRMTKITDDCSLVNDYAHRFLLGRELVHQDSTCQVLQLKGYLIALSANDPNRKARIHYVAFGQHASSKSWLMESIENSCIPIVNKFSISTLRANTESGNADGSLDMQDEMAYAQAGVGKNGRAERGEEERTFKQVLSTGELSINETYFNEYHERKSRQGYRKCLSTHMMNTNAPKRSMTPEFLDRCHAMLFMDFDRVGRNVPNLICATRNPELTRMQEDDYHQKRLIHAMVYILDMMITIVIFDEVQTAFTDEALPKVLVRAAEVGLPRTNSPRSIQRLRTAIRVITKLRAIITVFCSSLGSMQGRRFSLQLFRAVQGLLCDYDPSIFVLGVGLFQEYEDPVQSKIIKEFEKFLTPELLEETKTALKCVNERMQNRGPTQGDPATAGGIPGLSAADAARSAELARKLADPATFRAMRKAAVEGGEHNTSAAIAALAAASSSSSSSSSVQPPAAKKARGRRPKDSGVGAPHAPSSATTDALALASLIQSRQANVRPQAISPHEEYMRDQAQREREFLPIQEENDEEEKKNGNVDVADMSGQPLTRRTSATSMHQARLNRRADDPSLAVIRHVAFASVVEEDDLNAVQMRLRQKRNNRLHANATEASSPGATSASAASVAANPSIAEAAAAASNVGMNDMRVEEEEKVDAAAPAAAAAAAAPATSARSDDFSEDEDDDDDPEDEGEVELDESLGDILRAHSRLQAQRTLEQFNGAGRTTTNTATDTQLRKLVNASSKIIAEQSPKFAAILKESAVASAASGDSAAAASADSGGGGAAAGIINIDDEQHDEIESDSDGEEDDDEGDEMADSNGGDGKAKAAAKKKKTNLKDYYYRKARRSDDDGEDATMSTTTSEKTDSRYIFFPTPRMSDEEEDTYKKRRYWSQRICQSIHGNLRRDDASDVLAMWETQRIARVGRASHGGPVSDVVLAYVEGGMIIHSAMFKNIHSNSLRSIVKEVLCEMRCLPSTFLFDVRMDANSPFVFSQIKVWGGSAACPNFVFPTTNQIHASIDAKFRSEYIASSSITINTNAFHQMLIDQVQTGADPTKNIDPKKMYTVDQATEIDTPFELSVFKNHLVKLCMTWAIAEARNILPEHIARKRLVRDAQRDCRARASLTAAMENTTTTETTTTTSSSSSSLLPTEDDEQAERDADRENFDPNQARSASPPPPVASASSSHIINEDEVHVFQTPTGDTECIKYMAPDASLMESMKAVCLDPVPYGKIKSVIASMEKEFLRLAELRRIDQHKRRSRLAKEKRMLKKKRRRQAAGDGGSANDDADADTDMPPSHVDWNALKKRDHINYLSNHIAKVDAALGIPSNLVF